MSFHPVRGKRLQALPVYLTLSCLSSLLFTLVFTVNVIYHTDVLALKPLQLVLVGTVLEATVFLFEVPTGIVADVKSRRLSIVIGTVLIGIGFLVEGMVPVFQAVVAAQVIWGVGYTFTSGATQAWIADEVGDEKAGDVFIRGAQFAQLGSLAGLVTSILIGSRWVRLPIIAGGWGMLALAVFLAVAMPEEHFSPRPCDRASPWRSMVGTVRESLRLVARRPGLVMLLAIGLFYGLYSEGVDRLWTAHLLRDIGLPSVPANLGPVLWVGFIEVGVHVLSIGATALVRRQVDTTRDELVGRVLAGLGLVIVAALIAFALSEWFWLAAGLIWIVQTARAVTYPLLEVWVNRQIDEPRVRATVLSVTGQVDAVGQIAGGPLVGLAGNRWSVRSALLLSAALLAPVLGLYSVWLARLRGGSSVDSELTGVGRAR